METTSKPQRLIATNVLTYILLAIVLAGAFAFFWWREGGTVSLAYNSTAIASAPVFVARDGTFLMPEMPKAGRTISSAPFNTGAAALDALLGGHVEAATVADVPIVAAFENRPDLRIILTICVSPPRIVARKDRVANLQALKGKTIGTSVDTSAAYFLTLALKSKHLAPSDVKIVNLSPADGIVSLQNGSVDAISAWEPLAELAISRLGSNALVFDSPRLYMEHFNIVTTKANIDSPRKRADLMALVDSLSQATATLNERPGDAKELVAKELGLGPDQVNMVWKEFMFPASLDAEDLTKSLAQIQVTLHPGSAVLPSDIIDDTFVQKLHQ